MTDVNKNTKKSKEYIILDDHFKIKQDSMCWTLYSEIPGGIHPITKKPGMTRNSTYWPSLKLALKKYCDESLKGCENWQEIVDKIELLNQKIDNHDRCK
jgi:hypothetical protein